LPLPIQLGHMSSWDCRKKSTITLKSNHCVNSRNENKHNTNQCSHDLASVTHKVQDHHLHYEWQWLAAITLHWLPQLPMPGVDPYMVICSKLCSRIYTKLQVLKFCHISWSNGKTLSWCQLALKRHSL
jgi:hypothetical protein